MSRFPLFATGRLVVPALLALLWLQTAIIAQDPALNGLVQQLDSDSFYARRDAAEQLIDFASQSESHATAAIAALRQGASGRSIELRLACKEIQIAIHQIQLDQQVERLLDPNVDSAAVTLSGWQLCSSILGTDMAARRSFAAIHQNHSAQLRLLDQAIPSRQLQKHLSRIDPYRICPEETEQWMLLLMLETLLRNEHFQVNSARTCIALSNSQLGPKPRSTEESMVIRRVVDQWLGTHDHRCPTPERLIIAVRYSCRQRVEQICDQVWGDAMAAPATQVMAMLCASSIDRSDCQAMFRSRLDDQRTSHVWQLIGSEKKKIRTQVRDVALALLLYHQDIDPRSVGFHDLQADPLLVFQDHSLGFPDDTSRRLAHQQARELLSIDPSN